MKYNHYAVLLISIFYLGYACADVHTKDKVDFIIFSCNRPMQLYALLESMYTYMSGIGNTYIIYKITTDEYRKAYADVQKTFPQVIFCEEGNQQHSFFTILCRCAFESPHNYFSISVDDIVVKDYVDLNACIDCLQRTKAYAFFLRLGHNTTYCYMQKKPMPIPQGKLVNADMYTWKFSTGQGDWSFPNNVDMTIYKKADVKADISTVDPNLGVHVESGWSKRAPMNRMGLCFRESKIVNITMNAVYDTNMWQFSSQWRSRMHEFSLEKLLQKFNAGYKIDIKQLYKINNNAPHMEWEPVFIAR